ncbi:hypothetical protein ACQEU8_00020 [Streptomyces sp. CA-250714]|uniref:hypothetical protein n=1 Tax=Streptomyces sp. CA-250714 TaxID=3240060 RepID=UPI003D942325
MLTALVSAKSDGVTTSATAMALASSRPVLLAELDLSGGTLRHGLLRHAPSGEGGCWMGGSDCTVFPARTGPGGE